MRIFGSRPLCTALLAGALLGGLTLTTGFFTDDYVHLLTLSGAETPGAPLDLFCFGTGNASLLRPFIASGQLPWFTLPELKIWFLRPLTSATLWLDHILFGTSAFWFHLHSLGWYLAAIGAAWLLLRPALSPSVAALAILLFALDAGHAIPVAWWSNRGALVAGVPALLGLAAHLRWREKAWRPGLGLSLCGYGLALLGGEAALGIFGYLFAYELLGRREDIWRRRFAALVPAGLLCAAYLLIYWWLGRGTSGAGSYIDPVREPLRFLAEAPAYFFSAVATQFLLLQRELAGGLPLPWIGAGMLGMLTVLCLRLRAQASRGLAWLAPGAMLSCIPVLTGAASGRMLFFPSIGAAAVLGFVLVEGWRQAGAGRFVYRGIAAILGVVHLILAPLCWIAACLLVGEISRQANAALETIPLNDQDAAQTRLVVLTQPDPLVGMFGPMMRAAAGHTPPRSWCNLTLGRNSLRITRTAPRRVEVEFLRAPILKDGFEQTFRSEEHPYEVGDTVALDGMMLTVLEESHGRPSRIALDFEDDPDAAGFVFARWEEGRYNAVALPELAHDLILEGGARFPAW